MMMVARQKGMTGKLPEENKASKTLLKEADQHQDSQPETEAEGMQAIVETSAQEQELMLDFPFRKSDCSFPDQKNYQKWGWDFKTKHLCKLMNNDDACSQMFVKTPDFPTAI